MNPYLISNVIASYENDTSYLASIDAYGTYIESDYTATGFGSYYCAPIVENFWKPDCDEEHARKIVEECFKVCFYRDARASDVIQIAVIDTKGTRYDKPYRIETKWDFKGYVNRANEKLHAV